MEKSFQKKKAKLYLMKKKNKKQWLPCIAFLCCLIFLLLFCGFFYKINHKYPQPTEEIYAIQQPMIDRNLQYTVTDFKCVRLSELQKNFPQTEFSFNPIGNGEIKNAEDMCILLWFLEIKNISTEPQKSYIYDFVCTTKTWHNGLDMQLFYDLNAAHNPDASLTPLLKPKEQIGTIVPIPISSAQLPSKDWNNVEQLEYELLFTLYPKKIAFSSVSNYNVLGDDT